jgi:serine/threonine protein phosphatase 1
MQSLFSNLFAKTRPPPPPTTTNGRVVYAVGDVHGCLDVLRPLMEELCADAARTDPAAEPPVLVFLGDYVDRGPDSARVIDLILHLEARGDFEVHALKGNHEEAMLTFLDDPAFGVLWMKHGGAETLSSYGVPSPVHWCAPQAWVETRDALLQALPAKHLSFLLRLKPLTVVGDYAFVHAGVRPGVPVEKQKEHDLLWIRHEFLEAQGPFGKVIVHGHTPSEAPEFTPWRIGIDTAAYATGVLTAVRIHESSARIIQSRVPAEPAAALTG